MAALMPAPVVQKIFDVARKTAVWGGEETNN